MVMARSRAKVLVLVVAGICVGVMLQANLPHAAQPANGQSAAQPAPDLASLAADIETLKGKATDQSHVMQDVSYHFSNLWFAGQHENWDLANFYWSETRSHLRWAVRVIPKRKDNAGQDVDLIPILEGFENGPLSQLQAAIAAHDKAAFEKSYRTSMETCYGCHKAADKPFLRPKIPTRPETPLMNFDPRADWPR
jgi:hypothetical protein